MNRNDGNKTQRRYKFNSSYALSKPILDNGIYGERITQIPLNLLNTIDLLAKDPR